MSISVYLSLVDLKKLHFCRLDQFSIVNIELIAYIKAKNLTSTAKNEFTAIYIHKQIMPLFYCNRAGKAYCFPRHQLIFRFGWHAIYAKGSLSTF